MTSCGSNKRLNLVVGAGQTMNISVWNFKPSTSSVGTLRDRLSGNNVDIVGTQRYQHVAKSVGNTVQLQLTPDKTNDLNLLVDIRGELYVLFAASVQTFKAVVKMENSQFYIDLVTQHVTPWPYDNVYHVLICAHFSHGVW